MNLENIGFYSLSEYRAMNASETSPVMRNELIITSLCNFKCPYCRGTDINGIDGHMDLSEIKYAIDVFAENNIRNIRFSGGEPTIHPMIKEIVSYTKNRCKNIKNIAISTNGSRSKRLYKELVDLGVTDYSISLDACCADTGDKMAGNKKGVWQRVVNNIKYLSSITYVTVGLVMDHDNVSQMRDTILFAHSLGVADIRLISAAQWDDKSIFDKLDIPDSVLNCHPILKYRLYNFRTGRNVRGIRESDSDRCGMSIDDVIAKGKYHYKCVIHMREGGKPLGLIGPNMRKERADFANNFNTKCDEICNKNCLDVCVDYNNKYHQYNNIIATSNDG